LFPPCGRGSEEEEEEEKGEELLLLLLTPIAFEFDRFSPAVVAAGIGGAAATTIAEYEAV